MSLEIKVTAVTPNFIYLFIIINNIVFTGYCSLPCI